MPVGWRIVKSRYATRAFDGEGARLHGGRWTRRGTPAVYTAEHVSLAILEILVHLRDARFLSAYSLAAAHLDDSQVERLAAAELPPSWRRFPPPPELQAVGERWFRSGASVALEVPSAVVPEERNYLLNPLHPDFASLRIDPPSPYELDLRLLSG